MAAPTISDHYIACDIGSNAMRILVGRVFSYEHTLKVQKQTFIRLPIRLGDDVFSGGTISQPKISKLVESCKIIKSLERVYSVKRTAMVATSAIRESSNKEQIIEELAKEELYLNIIDGDTEAKLVQLVVQHLEENPNKDQLFIDVGGGSTELIHFGKKRIENRQSFKIGTVRELLGKENSNEWEKLEQWIKEEYKNNNNLQIVGTGGTINTLSKILVSQNKQLSLGKLDAFIDEARSLSLYDRQQRWDLREDKADVVVFGCNIYSKIMHLLGVDTISVPRVGVADGLILQTWLEDKE